VHVHLAAAHAMGRVALLEGDKLEPGDEASAQLVLEAPIGALPHDRFIIRDQSAQSTIGGGTVVDPFASTRNRRKPERLIRLDAMAHSADEAARRLIAHAPGYFQQPPFAVAFNLPPGEAEQLWREADAVVAGPFVFGRSQWIAARQALIDMLAAHHQKAPEQPGLQPERLRNAMEIRLAKEAFAEVLAAELKIGGVTVDGPWLRLPAHVVSLSQDSELHWRHIELAIRAQRFRPPRVRDFAQSLDIEEEETRNLMRRVTRMGRVIEVAHDHFYLRETVAEMIGIAADVGAADAAGKSPPPRSATASTADARSRFKSWSFSTNRASPSGAATVAASAPTASPISARRRDPCVFVYAPFFNAGRATGRDTFPVGRSAFKAEWGRFAALRGFDSHSLPPIVTGRADGAAFRRMDQAGVRQGAVHGADHAGGNRRGQR